MSLHTYFSHNVAANIYVAAAGIEGFNLLHGIPHSDSKYIPPQEFPDYLRDNIFACLNCANSTFSNEFAVKKECNDWAQLYCPPTNNLYTPASRLSVPRDEQLVMDLNSFMTNVGPVYYDTVLRGTLITVAQLKDMIDRRVGYKGEVR